MDSEHELSKKLYSLEGNSRAVLRWSASGTLTTALSSSRQLSRTATGNVAVSSTSTTIEFEDEAEVFDKLLSPKLLQLFHPAVSKVKLNLSQTLPSVSGHGERKGILIGNTKVFKGLIRNSMWENFQSGPCEMLRFLLDEEEKRAIVSSISQTRA